MNKGIDHAKSAGFPMNFISPSPWSESSDQCLLAFQIVPETGSFYQSGGNLVWMKLSRRRGFAVQDAFGTAVCDPVDIT